MLEDIVFVVVVRLVVIVVIVNVLIFVGCVFYEDVWY